LNNPSTDASLKGNPGLHILLKKTLLKIQLIGCAVKHNQPAGVSGKVEAVIASGQGAYCMFCVDECLHACGYIVYAKGAPAVLC